MVRDVEVGRIRARLQRLHSPRLQMMLIVALTGAAAMGASVLLRAQGLSVLWQRYALAVAAAYVVFLVLLRLWVRLHEHDLVNAADLPDGPSLSPRGGRSGSGDDGGLFDDLDLPDGDGLGLVLLGIAALVAAVGAVFWAVWIAPTLLAELVLDVALASGLYRRLRGIQSQHWLSTALRRTALPFVLVLLLAAGAGALVQRHSPGADTIGDAFATTP